jgi:predicted MarR family transcription regulator
MQIYFRITINILIINYLLIVKNRKKIAEKNWFFYEKVELPLLRQNSLTNNLKKCFMINEQMRMTNFELSKLNNGGMIATTGGYTLNTITCTPKGSSDDGKDPDADI